MPLSAKVSRCASAASSISSLSPDAPDAFSVQLNYSDKRIRGPKELREYLASLEDAGLIADGATGRNKIVDGLFDTPDAGERVVTIDTDRAVVIAK